MSVCLTQPPDIQHAPPMVRLVDDKRGTFGMALFIATEACLFIMMFFAYFYIGHGHPVRWFYEEPPKLHYSLPMLAILLSSSAVLYWGEQNVKRERYAAGKLALMGTLFLGAVFLLLTYLEYSEHLRTLTPTSNAYGSVFYTIVTIHGMHVVLGMLMLTWVFLLPRWEPALRTPHRPYHNVGMYWHFVDTVWVLIVLILYVIPNIHATLL